MISHRPRPAAWRAITLAALLLLAQALGLAHAVAHGPALAAQAQEPASDDRHGHEAGSAECRLADAHGWLDVAAASRIAPDCLPHGATCVAAPPPWRGRPAPRWTPPARGPPR